ncbi:MAG: asparagine synthetase B, partial [Bacteroidota bacterium]|nr:asparagine synthetase B [Bacteroidota bacterium]
MRRLLTILCLALLLALPGRAQDILIPMDESQSDHLKAYGVTYWALERSVDVDWLLNYRGGSFLMIQQADIEAELRVRGVHYEILNGSRTASIISEVESDAANTSVVRLEKPPRIAVYAPDQTLPWDDAVLLALNYAEVPYDMIYDEDILTGALDEYDWLHLHHEDFTGQYGKFFNYRATPWYIEQQRQAEMTARRNGFRKVSGLKLEWVQTIRAYVGGGGFLFAMCSGTDTFDIALASHQTDIVPSEYDGDPVDPDALARLDFSNTFAFTDFRPVFNAREYEHSDIDSGPPPQPLRNPAVDYFTLFEFSAKYDQVPTMLTQNHVATVKGFIGQTTNFRKHLVEESVVILAE